MSVSTNIPEVKLLLQRAEEMFGAPLQTHNAFIALSGEMDATLREHVSESTLERLWGYSTRSIDAVSLRTLDVLSRYCGYPNWKEFTQAQNDGEESEEFALDGIAADDLQPGACLRVGWLPNRQIVIRLGQGRRFVVEQSLNSSLQPGDSFVCAWFQLARPLYLDHFRRNGSSEEKRYVAGERSGLVLLERI